MRQTAATALAIAAAFALTSCGGSDEGDTTAGADTTTAETTTEAASLPCMKPPQIAVENISLGLTQGGRLSGAKFVDVPTSLQTQGWPEWLIAARVKAAVGIWATNRDADATIMAIDEVARMYTDWGAAAAPGSHARELMDMLAASDAATAVVACVG